MSMTDHSRQDVQTEPGDSIPVQIPDNELGAAGPGYDLYMNHRPPMQFDLASVISHCQRLAKEDVALGLRYGHPPWLPHSYIHEKTNSKTQKPDHLPSPLRNSNVSSRRKSENYRARKENRSASLNDRLSAEFSAAISREARKIEQDDGLDHIPCKQETNFEAERKRASLILNDIKYEIEQERKAQQFHYGSCKKSFQAAQKSAQNILRLGRNSIKAMHPPSNRSEAEQQVTEFSRILRRQVNDFESSLALSKAKNPCRLSETELAVLTSFVLEELFLDTVQVLSLKESKHDSRAQNLTISHHSQVESSDKDKYRIARILLDKKRSSTHLTRATSKILTEAEAVMSIFSNVDSDIDDLEENDSPTGSQFNVNEFHDYVRNKDESFYTSFGILPSHLMEITANSIMEEMTQVIAEELQDLMGQEIDIMAKEELTPVPNLRTYIEYAP